MKPIEQLRKYIKTTHPLAAMSVTPPLIQEGVWFIEIICGNQRLIIEWSLATGFGISSLPTESYGERPDETYKSLKDVQRRITELLTGTERATPSIGVLLSRLREQRGYTQEQLASKLNVSQATISGIERRDDIQFSTLQKVIEALGGVLQISIAYSDVRYRLAPDSVAAAHEDAEMTGVPYIDLIAARTIITSPVDDATEKKVEPLSSYRQAKNTSPSNADSSSHVPRTTSGRAARPRSEKVAAD